MKLTPEQSAIVSYVSSNDGYIKVNAVAGAGKTSLLVSIAKTLNPTNALYLAYNKAIATEASRKFPKSVSCSTVHSLAYRPTVIAHKLSLGQFNYRNINQDINYDRRCELVSYLKEYFLSRHIHFSEFIEAEGIPITAYETTLLESYVHQMESGDIDCTHEFYLKYFHILLATGHVTYQPFDFIALDEAGDINPVTLEIFKLLPSAKKLLVGDSRQNIYSFNHTINCFHSMRDTGKEFPMSKSFRVSPSIAERVQHFCRTYIDPSMNFEGTPQSDAQPVTRAYIARTNTALISKMIELNEIGTPYTLTRSADDIFSLPKALSMSKYRGFMPTEFKYLQQDINDFYEDRDLIHTHKTHLAYLKHLYKDDVQVSTAIGLILKYRTSGVLACYEEAKKHECASTNYHLGTAHSTKGLEYDEVYIADDLNAAVELIQIAMTVRGATYSDLSAKEQTEINLYYVACTRAHKVLLNATQLEYQYIQPKPLSRGSLYEHSEYYN